MVHATLKLRPGMALTRLDGWGRMRVQSRRVAVPCSSSKVVELTLGRDGLLPRDGLGGRAKESHTFAMSQGTSREVARWPCQEEATKREQKANDTAVEFSGLATYIGSL